jgi:tRNA threonylcarbamoyladenosine biosynthesis protein TsaE
LARRERERALGHLDFSLDDAAATRALGARLAAACPPDSVILLRGPLGAGKTTLVEGFLDALGAGRAASPTFVIAHSHQAGAMPVWHLDLYRLEDPRDVDDLDLAQYLPAGGITLVEWPERAAHVWPEDRIEIDLAIAGAARTARVQGFGSGAAVTLSGL